MNPHHNNALLKCQYLSLTPKFIINVSFLNNKPKLNAAAQREPDFSAIHWTHSRKPGMGVSLWGDLPFAKGYGEARSPLYQNLWY